MAALVATARVMVYRFRTLPHAERAFATFTLYFAPPLWLQYGGGCITGRGSTAVVSGGERFIGERFCCRACVQGDTPRGCWRQYRLLPFIIGTSGSEGKVIAVEPSRKIAGIEAKYCRKQIVECRVARSGGGSNEEPSALCQGSMVESDSNRHCGSGAAH